MSLFIVDVEADGPYPGDYSMVCFGAVLVSANSDVPTFYGQVRPLTDNFVPEALAVSGFSRTQHLTFDDPKEVMTNFADWIKSVSRGKPIFITDNLAFDWQWINYYFHKFTGSNPFGFSGRRIGDVYAGLVRDMRKASEWKQFRKTPHTHNPVDDAMGNLEALLYIQKEYQIKIA